MVEGGRGPVDTLGKRRDFCRANSSAANAILKLVRELSASQTQTAIGNPIAVVRAVSGASTHIPTSLHEGYCTTFEETFEFGLSVPLVVYARTEK